MKKSHTHWWDPVAFFTGSRGKPRDPVANLSRCYGVFFPKHGNSQPVMKTGWLCVAPGCGYVNKPQHYQGRRPEDMECGICDNPRPEAVEAEDYDDEDEDEDEDAPATFSTFSKASKRCTKMAGCVQASPRQRHPRLLSQPARR